MQYYLYTWVIESRNNLSVEVRIHAPSARDARREIRGLFDAPAGQSGWSVRRELRTAPEIADFEPTVDHHAIPLLGA